MLIFAPNNKTNDMKTFQILNHLEDVVKTVITNDIEEVQDTIYDLRSYHGFNNTYTYNEVIK